jgi:hypothetical protein
VVAPQFNGLVMPDRTERELNGERGGRRPVDADGQTEVALNAFERAQILCS